MHWPAVACFKVIYKIHWLQRRVILIIVTFLLVCWRNLIPPHTWGKGWAKFLPRHFAQPFPLVCGEILVRKSRRDAKKKKLTKNVCLHSGDTSIIFFPSFVSRTGNKQLHNTQSFYLGKISLCKFTSGFIFPWLKGHTGDYWTLGGLTSRRITALIILPWTPKICLECLLCCNRSRARSSHYSNHRQRTVSYRPRNKLFPFCFNIQSFYQ